MHYFNIKTPHKGLEALLYKDLFIKGIKKGGNNTALYWLGLVINLLLFPPNMSSNRLQNVHHVYNLLQLH